MLDLLWK